MTPRNSLRGGDAALPLQPQTTGEWYFFPSFRQSLLGGKTLNRFSSFVTTGAEDWVLKGTSTDLPATAAQNPSSMYINDEEDEDEDDKESQDPGLSRPDRHFIEHGPTWKPKLPGFRVMVHSPSKRSSGISGSYTVYLVTSLFFPTEPQDSLNENLASPTRITVHRRFSHFVFLHTALTRRLPGIALPPLPEKQYAGRFSEEFVEARRGDLERYLSRVIRHPVARYAEVLTFFLGCENETVRLPRPLNTFSLSYDKSLRSGRDFSHITSIPRLQVLRSTRKFTTLHLIWMRRTRSKPSTDFRGTPKRSTAAFRVSEVSSRKSGTRDGVN